MTIEKLTDEERERLSRTHHFGHELDNKVLRIIDAHAAALAARDQRVAELEELATEREVQLKTAWGEHAAWKARANDMSKHYQDQAARAELAESEVARLREELAAAELEQQRFEDACANGERVYDELADKYRAAEARVRELEAHLVASDGARTRVEQQLAAAQAALSVSQEAGAQLLAERDAANALLERAYPHCPDAVTRAIEAHLSAQPAAPAVAYGSSPVGGANLRAENRPSVAEFLAARQPAAPTDHDRAVLWACENATCSNLDWLSCQTSNPDLRAIAIAEVARREAKKAPNA